MYLSEYFSKPIVFNFVINEKFTCLTKCVSQNTHVSVCNNQINFHVNELISISNLTSVIIMFAKTYLAKSDLGKYVLHFIS